ncbi:MAG: hypothetical protein C0609_12325 [Deltaproteobacteria bacterium]|nr:MAG: hypothetical protein C0609_12325 [Deltaproteobacteria bacterium]
MCTLHLLFKCAPGEPLLFAANRDEFLAREWEWPGELSRLPAIYGPRDLAGGGTWTGVNECGLLVALANHEGTLSSGGSLCSRGYVVKETLRHENAAEAVDFARAIAPACKSYTMLIADPNVAFVAENAMGELRLHPLKPGPHVITNRRFGEAGDTKAERSVLRLNDMIRQGRLDDGDLSEFLGDHHLSKGQFTPLCVHEEGPPGFGTSSSSIIRVDSGGRVTKFLFAPGHPCTTEFVDVTPDFQRVF